MDIYQRLANGIQARRRYIEGIDSAISTAIGIRADLLPHQLAVVRRVLTDTSIRHLLADEVGLGKTIEALMIINAFKAMAPDERVAIVVPNAKYREWTQDEVFGRAHDAPAPIEQLLPGYAEGIAPHERRNVFLFYPSLEHQDFLDDTNSHQLLPQVLEPGQFGLVVVDEIHNLTNSVRGYLVRNASRFANLLLLSATPRIADPTRRLELLALLEPQIFMAAYATAQRSGIAAPEAWHDFKSWTSDFHRIFRESTPQDARILHRRIIRTKRAVLRSETLPKAIKLPHRNFQCIRIQPTENEVEIHERALEIIRGNHDGLDRAAFARRACVGGASLRDAIGDRRRVGNFSGSQLDDLKKAVTRNRGADSRLDSLTSVLIDVWCADPTEKIVVACNDVPTIDYLATALRARLPRVGQVFARTRLTISTLRDDSEQSIRDLQEFTSGSAQLLLASVQSATVGLNLQMARTLVFYTIPFTVEEIDQWIGRLDRIGSCAVTQTPSQPTIRLLAFTFAEHFDDKVCTYFQQQHVFQESIDPEDVVRVADLNIIALRFVLGGALVSTSDTKQCESLAIQGVDLDECMAAYGVAMQLQPQPPALMSSQHASRPPWLSREIACEQWLRSLDLSNEYAYKARKQDVHDPSVTFRTLWYRMVVDDTTITLPQIPDPHPYNPKKKQAFETRRPAVQIRPRTAVALTADPVPVNLQLQFFSHGGRLHDALVKAWAEVPAESEQGFWFIRARVQAHHAAAVEPGRGRYMVTYSWVDAGNPTNEALQWEHAADVRWVRDILNGFALPYVERLGDSKEVLEPKAAHNLMSPFEALQGGDPPARFFARITSGASQSRFMSGPDHVAGLLRHRERLKAWALQRILERWGPLRERLQQSARLRVTGLQGDLEATATHLRHLIDVDRQRIVAAAGPETRLAEGRLAKAEQLLAETHDAFSRRRQQIERARELIDDPPLHFHRSFLLEVDVVP